MTLENHEEELQQVNRELKEVEANLAILLEKRNTLKERKECLTELIWKTKSEIAGSSDEWEKSDFPWSSRLESTLKNVFKLNSFRSNQLPVLNATLSKKDLILIMPTGGGKSLCYQLPAVIDRGFTLVISPMVSLIEDQVIQLKSLSISAEMFHASITPQKANETQQMMVDPKSGIKLIYVTPEKLAKSKRFMTKLQKSYSMGLLSRIAIDEVHCCSQWGHDFRTDYQFLSVLKGMFPDVPMIGLTATATSKVILDVQKMLLLRGCLIFKSSFNRPNLYYEVKMKPSNRKQCLDLIEHMLEHRFKNMSGIIYTISIKDCEDLCKELRNRGLRNGAYHAQLDPSLRSKVHHKWLKGEYRFVVATIAFGLGIDKPDVRFVIHYSLSKSMENFYQESGRAGRDGQRATCIMLYRFADVFKLSPMVFSLQTGLRNLYSVLEYCLNYKDCRRKIIASHFDEAWESTDCNKMCDHCEKAIDSETTDITKYCRTLYEILDDAFEKDIKLTAQMLIDTWNGKNTKIKIKKPNWPASVDKAANIMAFLLMNDYLKEDFHFTPYTTISYLKKGSKASSVAADNSILMCFPKNETEGGYVPRKSKKRSLDDDDSTKFSNKNRCITSSTTE